MLRSAVTAPAKVTGGNNASMSARSHDNGGTSGVVRSNASHSVGSKPKAPYNMTHLDVDKQSRYNQVYTKSYCGRLATMTNVAAYLQ